MNCWWIADGFGIEGLCTRWDQDDCNDACTVQLLFGRDAKLATGLTRRWSDRRLYEMLTCIVDTHFLST